MKRALLSRAAWLCCICQLFPVLVQGGEVSEAYNSDTFSGDDIVSGDSPALDLPQDVGLTYLVPEMEGRTFQFSGAASPYLHRLGFSPGVGRIGIEPLTAFRLSYAPSRWLEYEASVGHNRGQSVHALVHLLSGRLRYPLAFRIQPYVTVGFGMILVFPGASLNTSPVTKNILAAGGGLEVFLSDDLAVRAELRRLGVFGRDAQQEESAVFGYSETTLGFSFYRHLEP